MAQGRENTLELVGTHDHRDAHGRVPCRNGGHSGCGAVARLCLTLPRTTPRLRVLILISPFKFLWHGQHARAKPTFHRPAGIVFRARSFAGSLARSCTRRTIHHRSSPARPAAATWWLPQVASPGVATPRRAPLSIVDRCRGSGRIGTCTEKKV